jgi:conjugative transfer region lipoprotein (TIGR03751 family)
MASIFEGRLGYRDSGLKSVRQKTVHRGTRRYRSSYTSRAREDRSSFDDSPKLLPNPTIMIYVYPHFDGDDQDYVPGHMAYTKFYKETHFALPGEPVAYGDD